MADYLRLLLADLPWQFRDKARITALYEVLAGELQAVHDFFLQLRDRRHIAAAEGRQLDGIGDIVVLSRAQAGLLAGNPIPYNVLSDEEYRTFLHYKIFKNTSICTYADVMKSVRMFWGRGLYYAEDPEQPATMIFNTPILAPDDDARKLLKSPLIRAAGVTLFLTATTESPEENAGLQATGALGGSHMQSELPPYLCDREWDGTICISGGCLSVMVTELPQLERRQAHG